MPISQNRIDPCLEAILNQMNLCPVWPPSNNVDLRKISTLDLNEKQIPNLIIVPSKVGVGFAKVNTNNNHLIDNSDKLKD